MRTYKNRLLRNNMTEHYLDILARTIRENWDQPALTDFYLTEDGKSQDTSRGNHYTYGEMYDGMTRLGEWFRALGIKQSDHIAICGSNSANWAVAYLAITAYQGVAVTVMHTQNVEDIARQIDFSDSIALFTDKELWKELSQHDLPQIKYVIALDDFSLIAGTHPLPYYTDTIGIQKGYNKDNATIHHGELDNLAQICFTSASTGKAKGVMLSYKNISVTTECVGSAYPIHKNKKILSYFPLSHAFGLGLEIVVPITRGAHIYLYRGVLHIAKLLNAIRCVRPYLAVMVPSMVQKMADAGVLKLLLFKLLGIEYIIVGGSGVNAELGKKMKKFRIPIAPGYGMTETVALISLITPSTYRAGSSGKVCDALTIKLTQSGEILVRGENVMLGYYKDPEATAKKIDKDGWLHTGDAGYMDEDGYLYVTGRIGQDMIVLPNGENIHPEDIENKINAIQEVKESIVLAREGKLVAIVVVSEQQQEVRSQLRRKVLQEINPQLPLYSQLYDVELTDQPLARTAKQTIKRYLYK